MSGKEGLKRQFAFFYLTVKRNLEGFDAESALVQPSPGGNCANWVLAHMISVHNAAMGLVNEAPVWDGPGLERAGTEPVTSHDEAYDWDAMVAGILESEGRFLGGLGALTDDDLEAEGFTDPFGNPTTRAGLLDVLLVHQSYHSGQLAMCRRLAGLPGAIRAPARG